MRDKETKKRFDRSVLDGMTADEQREYMDKNVYWLRKFYRVFNCSLMDGVPAKEKPQINVNDRNGRAEAILDYWDKNEAKIVYGGNKAFYRTDTDEVHLPERSDFKSMQEFYSMSTLPLDDGARFKTWRETFITKIVIAYGTVFSVNIFVLLLPLITRMRIDEISGFGNSMFLIFMIVGGAMVIPAGQALFCKLFGQADDMHAGGNFLRSAFYGSRMVGAATFGLAHKVIHGGVSVGKAISNHRKNKADDSGGEDNSDKYSEEKSSAETTEGSESSGGESSE